MRANSTRVMLLLNRKIKKQARKSSKPTFLPTVSEVKMSPLLNQQARRLLTNHRLMAKLSRALNVTRTNRDTKSQTKKRSTIGKNSLTLITENVYKDLMILLSREAVFSLCSVKPKLTLLILSVENRLTKKKLTNSVITLTAFQNNIPT